MSEMKAILINTDNRDRIQEALDGIQSRARVRTIDASDVVAAADRASYQLFTRLGITRKSAAGLIMDVDLNARTFPHAYKGIPESTQYRMKWTGSAWKITHIARAEVSRHNFVVIRWPDEALQAMIAANSCF